MHKPYNLRSGDHESVEHVYLVGSNVSIQHDVDTMRRDTSSIA